MCGIAGYIGPMQAESVLLVKALERLKYRGCSAGMAISDKAEIAIRKSEGRCRLEQDRLSLHPLLASVALRIPVGPRTPTSINATHANQNTSIAVVHNGIIENHEQIRQELSTDGCVFQSQTDSEVLPNLLTKFTTGPPSKRFVKSSHSLKEFPFAAIFEDHPQQILLLVKVHPCLLARAMIKCSSPPISQYHSSYMRTNIRNWKMDSLPHCLA